MRVQATGEQRHNHLFSRLYPPSVIAVGLTVANSDEALVSRLCTSAI